jgi:hypothetical protein
MRSPTYFGSDQIKDNDVGVTYVYSMLGEVRNLNIILVGN